MINIIKKIWFYFKGFMNDTSEKYSNPALELRQVAREIEQERNNRRKQFVDTHTQITAMESTINEKQAMFDKAKAQAKATQEKGDERKAVLYAERCIQIKYWIDRMNTEVARGKEHLDGLKHDVEELDFQKQQLELEASMAESSMEMSKTEIKRSSTTGAGKNYDEIIKGARGKVKELQISADSHRVAFNTFDNNESETTKVSEDAKKFLESIK